MSCRVGTIAFTLLVLAGGCTQETSKTVCTAPIPTPVQRAVDGNYSQHPYTSPDCKRRR